MRAGVVLIMVLALGAGMAACEQTSATFVPTKEGDEALAKAESDARASADIFWDAWNERRPGDGEFMVKPGMRTRSGELEYIWVDLLSREGARVFGRLANDPNGFDAKYGDEVAFDVNEVVDWAFKRDGKMFGMYSTRALMSRLNPQQAAEARAILSDSPLPGAP